MDAAHAIQFQTYRSNIVRETKNEYKEKVQEPLTQKLIEAIISQDRCLDALGMLQDIHDEASDLRSYKRKLLEFAKTINHSLEES